MSKQRLLVNGHLPSQLVQDYLSKSRLLSMETCSGQSYSSKPRPLAQVNGHLSKQRLLVQVKAACQRQGYLSETRLLVRDKATCQRQGYLSETRLLVRDKATCPSYGY